MPDETTQPAQESQSESIPGPTQQELTPENPISETNPIPASPQEPTPGAPTLTTDPVPTEEPSGPTEATPNPEDTILVNNDISANEPLKPVPVPENVPVLDNPNITVEKRGNDVTITEVMKTEPEPKTETAQMAGNEPFDIVEEEKIKKRKENLKLANETRQEKKREKINEILNLFAERQTVTNDEVEKLLHVSDATATRYLETLEKEGKIKQVGKTGKGVSYTKI